MDRLNNTLLNNQQITEEIKKEIKICIETVCHQALPWPNCLCEDPQYNVIFLMYKEVKVPWHSWQP